MEKEQCLVNVCLADDCNGEYTKHIIKTVELRNGKSINVTETICNVCGDDYDARLVRFIKDNWN